MRKTEMDIMKQLMQLLGGGAQAQPDPRAQIMQQMMQGGGGQMAPQQAPMGMAMPENEDAARERFNEENGFDVDDTEQYYRGRGAPADDAAMLEMVSNA